MSIKSIQLTLFALFSGCMLHAQTFEWARTFSGTGSDQGNAIVVNDSGYVYTTGSFTGTADFDPGTGTSNLTAIGNNIFIQKMDSNGNLVWVKTFSGTTNHYGNTIAIDDSGNVYTGGSFTGTTDFDPGAGYSALTSLGGEDAFIQKMDANGNFIWVKAFGSSTSHDKVLDLAIDDSGNVYTTGFFSGTTDFDPDTGIFNVTLNGANNKNVFVHKMDANGNFIWVRTFGEESLDEGKSLALDDSANVYTTGVFSTTSSTDSVDFDPSAGVSYLVGNWPYVGGFIHKMDKNGNFIWARAIVGSLSASGSSIAVDPWGDIAVTGGFKGTTDFDPEAGVYNLTSSGQNDAYIQKLDPSGSLIWVRNTGGIGTDFASSVTFDVLGNTYVSGVFSSTVDFDPGLGNYSLSSLGGLDVYLQKLDVNGDFVWARSFGGIDTDIGYSLTLDTIGNILATGLFRNSVDFNPGLDTANFSSGGSSDVYILKLNHCTPAMSADTQSVCDSLTWIDGNTYTTSNNTATHTMMTTTGCDSIVTLNLTVLQSTTATDVHTSCDSLTWIDGNTYTSSNNTATHTLTNAAGCDSVVTLDLTILYSTTETDVHTACDSFTWIDGNTYTASINTATDTLTNAAGCDSIVTLDLTINHSTTATDVQTACDSFTWIDGNTYTTSNNTAIDTLTNAAGCDSIVSLDLTINYSNTGTQTETACDSYTWPANNQTYTTSGVYATTLINASGCDSVVTLNLTINSSSSGSQTETACDSYTWPANSQTYTATGVYTTTLTNAQNCDSVVTLNLSILNNAGTQTETACDSYTWPANSQTYTASGAYTATLTNAAGCDSVVTLNLTINNSNTGSESQTACDTYTWSANAQTYTSSGVYTATLTNAAGCDSVVTLNLTINNSNTGSESQTACDTYTWSANAQTYTSSGVYTATLTNAAGCDSVVTLNLTINNSNTGSESQTACDSYTWPVNSQTYTTSGMYTATLTNAAGCDSVVTLNLTVNNTSFSTQTEVACDSFIWSANSFTYDSSGVYIDTLTNIMGCDSIVTLDLTVNYTNFGSQSEEVCYHYTWDANGEIYMTTGLYTDTLTNTNGCDSIVTLDLTILDSTSSIVIDTACNEYISSNGITYSSTGVYHEIIPNQAGCDSNITIDLTIIEVMADAQLSFDQGIHTLKAIGSASSYQWIDCTNLAEIPGAIDSLFVPSLEGSYAVVFAINECLDTSSCITTPLGIGPRTYDNSIRVFPNPTRGMITIQSQNTFLTDARYEIRTIHGQLAQFSKLPVGATSVTLQLDELPKGTYMLNVYNNSATLAMQLIIM